ncbi:MAG: protein kinase [Pirellulales bacterium]
MKSASVCLLDDQLRSLLEEDLLPQEAADCEAHLATCPRCRDKVESLIGNADWWQEAQDSLRSPQDRTATIPPEKLSSIAPHADILRLLGPTDNPQMLGRIGSYEIVGILGRGGMGVVFKGFDPALNRFVAIKMLAPHLAASGAARKRFEREAQAAAAIVHDHVMAIHGVADWQGTPYLVMPYVRGASLQKRIDDQGPFQLREILRIGMQTAAGLAAAHAQGLVHRDIKPANIMLASGVERVALTDFGLARAVDDATLTRTGTLAGTPQYMSPEQARGQAVDFRSDLFSLGSVLYTLCTGRPPFRAETSYGILRLITDEEPRPIQQLSPDIPVWLCTLIGRLMAKNPADRFASADEVSKLLEKCLAHIEQPSLVSLPTELLPPATAVASPAQTPSRTFSRRSFAIASALLLAVIGVYFGMLATNPPEIAGTWQGEDWGTVVLKSEAAGQYAGEFSETVGTAPGQLHLKWSRIERRFNGTWKDGDERLGDLSLRLVDAQIRGAYSTSANSKTNPATPRLADLTWTRTTPPTASNASPPTKATTLENIPIYKSSFEILFNDPGIYRLSIHARRRANENPEAGPFIKELGTQVVEVLASDVSHPVALIERIRTFDKLPSKSPTYHYQLLSGTLTRSLGSQTVSEKEDSSFQTNLGLPRIVTCEHQSVTQLANFQEEGWQVQLELHVQRWAPDDTAAPKENRMRLGINLKSTPSHLVAQELQTKREDGKRFIGLTIPQDHIANVALIARSKNAARVLRRFHVVSQKGTAVAWLHWEIEKPEQAGTFPLLKENYEVSPANKEDGTAPTPLSLPQPFAIEPRLFNPHTREKAEETKIDLVVPFIGGSDLPLEVASGETKEALLFFDVSADQIEHEIWLRVSLDTLPQNIRPQNAFHTALGSSWKALRYPRPDSETADVELSIPLSNEGYDLPLNPGIPNDLNVQMQQLELLAPNTQGAGLDGSHDLVLQTSSDLRPEILASTSHAFSHHTLMRIRTRPAESKNLRTLASPSAEKIKEAFFKALQGNWKCVNITAIGLDDSQKLKDIDTMQFVDQEVYIHARGQKPKEKPNGTFELDASQFPAWITIKTENETLLGILFLTGGKLQLQFGTSKDRPTKNLSSDSVISLLLEKVPEPTNPNSVKTSSSPAAKVLADKVVIKSARTDRNQLLVDLEMNVLLTPSWLRSLYLGPDRPLTSADVQNRAHDYPLVSSVSDWPVNANYQLSSGQKTYQFAFLFPSNEAASLALKQVDDLSRKGPQTLTTNTALQLFRVEYDNKTYQGGIDIREGAAASTNLNAPVRLTLFVPYTFTLDDWKKFAAALEGPDVRILITQDAKGRNRPIQAALKIDPKYASHDLRSITEALEKLGLPKLPKESTRKEPDHDHE